MITITKTHITVKFTYLQNLSINISMETLMNYQLYVIFFILIKIFFITNAHDIGKIAIDRTS